MKDDFSMRVTFMTVVIALSSLTALGAVAPQLPDSEYLDAEVSTNLVLDQGMVGVVGLNLRLEFTGTSSNNVEVVLGRDADGDGSLSFNECGIRVGWDCGRYFLERVLSGERMDEVQIGTNDQERVIEWNCTVRKRHLRSLSIANETGPVFLSMTTNATQWLYDGEWNLMRLTARGTDVQDERFEYSVDQRGHVIILR